MRKVIFDINITIDGCCDHTKGVPPSDEMYQYFTSLLRGADQFVFGRKTYQLMVPYWPDVASKNSAETKAENEFAQAFEAVDKILVFSRSLDSVEGEKTRIVRTKPEEEILQLKQQQGKNILIGGLELLSQLIGTGLIDEYHFVVHPVIAGEGTRLLNGVNLQEQLRLELAETTVLKPGLVALRYVKQDA